MNREIRDIVSEPARRPRFPVERRLLRLIVPDEPPTGSRENPFGTAFAANDGARRDFDKSAQK